MGYGAPIGKAKATAFVDDVLTPKTEVVTDVGEQIVEEVIVGFSASSAARTLNGNYARKSPTGINSWPVYSRGNKHIVHLDDDTWVLKDGASCESGAYVYAYNEDGRA